MNRHYETDEEQEADKQGHNDAQRNRKDYNHDKYSDEPEDVAYWQGRKDEETKMKIEEEERQIEEDRLQRTLEIEKQEEETRQCEDEEDEDRQSVDDFDALMEHERQDMQSQDDERPDTEENLFRDILRDEREDND